MTTDSSGRHDPKNTSSSYKSDAASRQGLPFHSNYRIPQHSSVTSSSFGTPGSGSLPFDPQNRPKLMMRSSHVSSYFSHEGSIHLSGEYDGRYNNTHISNFNTGDFSNNTLEPIESECYKSTTLQPSSGLLYNIKAKKELASIDAIHDPQARAIVCAGKSHLGYYRFSLEDKSIVCTHDIVTSFNSQYGGMQSKRGKQIKFSTIADIKTGYQRYSNYVAICTNSTNIALYDISRRQNYDSAVVTSLAEHTRSINGFDFNMIQTNLILSGGQDGCIKIWDLRSNSAQKRSSGCDININTSFGSIRDTKWMPGYNFVNLNDKFTQEMRSHNGYKFASIHDSGVILKFDMRQPNQPERKINAHTGPGLCLNWHPHKDYIVSGGRDGKCSLWYFGDKNNGDSNSNAASAQSHNSHQGGFNTGNNSSNLAVVYPETTINLGSPITKLKFRPSYDKNVYNSMIAISCMGDDARVSIHSLARRYIPKHSLETPASAVGLVWWDSNLIFNIDKNNVINGWDISTEPTVLENLSPVTTAWRDIDGYGFTYVDQEVGSYESEQEVNKPLQHLKREHNLRKDLSPTSSNSNQTPGMLNKLGMSHKNFTSDKIQPRLTSTYSSKSLLSTNSFKSASTMSLNSIASNQTEGKSSYIMTLDLPYIFSSMRQKQLARMQREAVDPSINIFKETPVETFKYLVRELEFTLKDDKKTSYMKTATEQDSIKTDDEREKEDLMKKFGFTENATWTALINKNRAEEGHGSDKHSTFGSSKDSTISSDHIIGTANNTIQGDSDSEVVSLISSIRNKIKKEPETSKLSEALQQPHIDRKHRIKLLVRLVAAVNHNAAVYSEIDDLPNLKIWILIRDSLLWDLKNMNVLDESLAIEDNGSNSSHISNDSIIDDGNHQRRLSNDSLNSSRAMTSDHDSSFFEDHPQVLNEENKDVARKQMSALHKQLQDSKRKVLEGKSVDEVSKTENEETETETNHINQAPHGKVRTYSEGEKSLTYGIPMLGRRRERLSFIDTFMTDRRPLMGFMDDNTSNRYSPSIINSSPRSKISSIHSLTSGNNLRGPFMNKMMSHFGSPRGLDNPSLNRFLEDTSIVSSSDEDLMDSGYSHPYDNDSMNRRKTHLPPWDTRTFIQQLYKKAIEAGNILLGVNILLLFHNVYDIVPKEVVKDSLSEFISILHRFETFEIAAALLKHCPWDNIMGEGAANSSIQIYCDRCHQPIINDVSKELFIRERKQTQDSTHHTHLEEDPMKRFGYWYCDNCKKPNSLCVYCEKPMKKLAIGLLSCGHEGHFDCFQEWFLDENMDTCPAGCNITLNL